MCGSQNRGFTNQKVYDYNEYMRDKHPKFRFNHLSLSENLLLNNHCLIIINQILERFNKASTYCCLFDNRLELHLKVIINAYILLAYYN